MTKTTVLLIDFYEFRYLGNSISGFGLVEFG